VRHIGEDTAAERGKEDIEVGGSYCNDHSYRFDFRYLWWFPSRIRNPVSNGTDITSRSNSDRFGFLDSSVRVVFHAKAGHSGNGKAPFSKTKKATLNISGLSFFVLF